MPRHTATQVYVSAMVSLAGGSVISNKSQNELSLTTADLFYFSPFYNATLQASQSSTQGLFKPAARQMPSSCNAV